MILLGQRAATSPCGICSEALFYKEKVQSKRSNRRQIEIIFSQCKVVFRASPSAANGPLQSVLHICHYPRVAAFSGQGGLARG
jgi:hypothetical protein